MYETHLITETALSFQMDLGFNMNILDIGGGFTGSEFQLRQVKINGAVCKDQKHISKSA